MRPTPASVVRDATDLALLLNDLSSYDTFLARFMQIRPEKEPINPESFVSPDNQLNGEIASIVLEFLAVRGYTSDTNSGSATVEPRYESCLSLLFETRDALRSLDNARDQLYDGSFELICTLPEEDPSFSSKDPVDYEMRQITSALLSLCGTAEDSLIIVSPFLEQSGINWIKPGIEGALVRDVSVSFVSRELDHGEPNLEALEDLFEVAQRTEAKLRFYDYYKPRSESDSPLYTLHSKLIIADQKVAYVGSANFTRYGFNENFEVGVILRDGDVPDLAALVEELIEQSAVEVYSA